MIYEKEEMKSGEPVNYCRATKTLIHLLLLPAYEG